MLQMFNVNVPARREFFLFCATVRRNNSKKHTEGATVEITLGRRQNRCLQTDWNKSAPGGRMIKRYLPKKVHNI